MGGHHLQIYSDGGSRNNPGLAAFAYLIYGESGEVLEQRGDFLGIATNNFAEYKGLLAALEASLKYQPTEIACFLDSELIVKQLNGEYRVKDENLKKIYFEIKDILQKLGKVSFKHIPREKNKIADKMVNRTLDEKVVSDTHG